MGGAEAVRSYEALARVEGAVQALKSVGVLVRSIRHHTETRVRAHVFLCMLTYYAQRYMKEALRPMLFADDDLDPKATRDPVAPARRSSSANKKAATKQLEDGVPVESFRTLLHHMSTITRDTFVQQLPNGQANTFDLDTRPDTQHQKVYARIAEIPL